jgi:hypothetical protein
MNPAELREPIFPLMGGFSLPRPMRAPRLMPRPIELASDRLIFPGAWSTQRAQAIHPPSSVPTAPSAEASH